MNIRAMKMALEALEYGNEIDAITALRAAIEAAEKQEPVATVTIDNTGLYGLRGAPDNLFAGQKLYIHPQLAIHADWQLVPVEPTKNEIQAGVKESKRIGTPLDWLSIVYIREAMLSAAPKPENSHE